jgi:hypothetical protein
MYVAKDVVTLAFGYRKFSMVEMFTKDPAERKMLEQCVVSLFNLFPGMEGVVVANNAERLAMEMASIAKDNIIVKSLMLTLRNFGSNIHYLRARGMSTHDILKYNREAIRMGIRYQADEQKLNDLGVQRNLLIEKGNSSAAIQKIDDEIFQLKNRLSRNPVQDSIKAGLLPSLIDDIETEGSQNYYPGMLEKAATKVSNKLPSVVQKAGSHLFTTQDTQIYKVLNNAVKMTDFAGRHALYNHYVKNKGMDPKEAAALALEEFVNFDVPTHRSLEYLNQVGLVWFSKYALRILKSVAGSIKDRPFDVAMSILLASHIGLDSIYNSVLFVTTDIGNKISTPINALTESADDPVVMSIFSTILR